MDLHQLFSIAEDYDDKNNIFVRDVYSVSDKCCDLHHGLVSLINNMKSISYSFEFISNSRSYIFKDNVMVMYEICDEDSNNSIYISLTRDVNILIQCFFYMSIEYRNINSLKYLINNYITNTNKRQLFKICNYCRVKPLKYIILEYNDLNIPKELSNYLEDNDILNEIFYKEKPSIYISSILTDFNELIKNNNLSKILYKRLNAIGISEYKYKYCKLRDCNCKYYEPKMRINRILYCEVTSYKYRNKKPKYVAITFHQYDSTIYNPYNPYESYLPIDTHAVMKCKFIKRIPKFTDYSFKRPFRFSITRGIHDDFNNELENELFTFTDSGNEEFYPKGFYKINFSLLKRNIHFIKKLKYYKYYAFTPVRVAVSIRKKSIKKISKISLRNINNLQSHILQKYIKTKLNINKN